MYTKSHEKAAAIATLAKKNTLKTAATNAKSTMDTILSNATTAETNANTHHGLEVTLATNKLAAMNSAMATWKGRLNSSTTTEDPGKAAGAYLAASKAGLEATALTNLGTAIGKCVPTTGSWTGGACVGVASGLVKFALRKKLGVDNIAKAKATRETLLDAYCRASMTLGTTAADLAAGKEYYARANPGKRLDFDFSAV